MEHKSIATALATSERPFRFLNLPRELRLMVYEYLPVKVKYHALASPAPVGDTPAILLHSEYMAILVKKTLPGAMILATCRTINEEASGIIAQKIDYLRQQPIQYILDWDSVGKSSYSDLSTREINRVMWIACTFDPRWLTHDGEASMKPSVEQFIKDCEAWESRYHSTTDLKGISKCVVFVSRKEPDANPRWSETGIHPRNNDRWFDEEVVPSGRFMARAHVEFLELRKTRLSCVTQFPVDPVSDEEWRNNWEEGEFVSVQTGRNPVWIDDEGTLLLVQAGQDSTRVLQTAKYVPT